MRGKCGEMYLFCGWILRGKAWLCSGQQNPDTLLGLFSASAGGTPSLCCGGRRQL